MLIIYSAMDAHVSSLTVENLCSLPPSAFFFFNVVFINKAAVSLLDIYVVVTHFHRKMFLKKKKKKTRFIFSGLFFPSKKKRVDSFCCPPFPPCRLGMIDQKEFITRQRVYRMSFNPAVHHAHKNYFSKK